MKTTIFNRKLIVSILISVTFSFDGSIFASGTEDGKVRQWQLTSVAVLKSCARNSANDFNTLDLAGNDSPEGIWSDGITMWVADDDFWGYEKIYAYDMASKARNVTKDFNTLDLAGNDSPQGIWSDGITMWVVDDSDDKIYAYDMASKARDATKDFNTLRSAGNNSPEDIWSDGITMWVADDGDSKIYAYDMASKARDATKDFNTLRSAGNNSPEGIWSDGITMWVADDWDDKIYAYDMASKARDATRGFNTLDAAGNDSPEGLWSDGITLWVADESDEKLYAYDMLSKGATPAAPAIRLVMVGTGSLTVSWTAPLSDDDFIAYDLRHILSNAPDKADANWTVMQNVWTTGSEPLSYELTGLTGGEQYNVQVRAINGCGNGSWSATDTGTPVAQEQAATDFNGDGKTDFVDFFLFADAYGGTDPRFDLDGSGTVDFVDFFKFVDAFGS